MSVLVLGAGELGEAIIAALASHPSRPASQRISVLLRPTYFGAADTLNEDKVALLARLAAQGVTAVPGEIAAGSAESEAELAAIFRRFHTVVGAAGYGLPAGTQLRLARAALLAAEREEGGQGGSRLVRYLPWQFGLDYDAVGGGSAQDLFDEQLAVRALLRGQKKQPAAGEDGGLRWTIISTGLFTSYLFRADFGVVDLGARVARGLGGWDTRVTVTTPGDIGRVVAEVVEAPGGKNGEEGEESGIVYVAGDTLAYDEVADLVDRWAAARGEGKFARELWDLEHLHKELQEEPNNVMYKYRAVFARGQGTWWPVEKTLNYERGMHMVGVEEYLKGMDVEVL